MHVCNVKYFKLTHLIGAPESSHHEDFTQNDSNEITAAVDVWSLGCVLSEVCVWLAGGAHALQKYDRRRTREIKEHTALFRAGHAGCFHNGYQRLQAVDDTHENVRESLPGHDNITSHVIGMIEKLMLLPRGSDRHTPYALFERLQTFISPSLRLQDHASVDTFTLSSQPIVIGPPLQRILTPPQRPFLARELEIVTTAAQAVDLNRVAASKGLQLTLTYQEAKEYIRCIESKQAPDARVAHTVQILKANLKDRDFFYFVDTSPTMRMHQEEAREALRVYSSLTNRIDQNGLEVSFASSPKRVLKTSNAARLMTTFDRQEWDQMAFEDRFSTFINHHIIPRLPLPIKLGKFEFGAFQRKRISIFVLTDGRWGHDLDRAGGIERPVEDLIKKMTEKGVQVGRTQISIQFMRFGDDQDGIRHLNYLDHLGEDRNLYGYLLAFVFLVLEPLLTFISIVTSWIRRNSTQMSLRCCSDQSVRIWT